MGHNILGFIVHLKLTLRQISESCQRQYHAWSELLMVERKLIAQKCFGSNATHKDSIIFISQRMNKNVTSYGTWGDTLVGEQLYHSFLCDCVVSISSIFTRASFFLHCHCNEHFFLEPDIDKLLKKVIPRPTLFFSQEYFSQGLQSKRTQRERNNGTKTMKQEIMKQDPSFPEDMVLS